MFYEGGTALNRTVRPQEFVHPHVIFTGKRSGPAFICRGLRFVLPSQYSGRELKFISGTTDIANVYLTDGFRKISTAKSQIWRFKVRKCSVVLGFFAIWVNQPFTVNLGFQRVA